MTEVTITHHPVGNGHELTLQTVGDPNGVKVLMLHGGPGYYWLADNLVLLHSRLAAAGHNVCLLALSQRGCGLGPMASRYTDLFDDDLVKRARDLVHFDAPDILLGHSTGCMVALTALMEKSCTPRATALISPYTASLGEQSYWVTTKAAQYPRTFQTLHDFVSENWQTYKGSLPDDLTEHLYGYWGQLFFALPDRAMQIKAKLCYLNFHVIGSLPHVGTEGGEPFTAHHLMLKKWPDLSTPVGDTLWRIGAISANWWRTNYTNGYPFIDKVKAYDFSHVPLHILSGLDDDLTPPHTVQALGDILNVTPHFAENCGHLPEANVQGHLDIALAEFLGKICKTLDNKEQP